MQKKDKQKNTRNQGILHRGSTNPNSSSMDTGYTPACERFQSICGKRGNHSGRSTNVHFRNICASVQSKRIRLIFLTTKKLSHQASIRFKLTLNLVMYTLCTQLFTIIVWGVAKQYFAKEGAVWLTGTTQSHKVRHSTDRLHRNRAYDVWNTTGNIWRFLALISKWGDDASAQNTPDWHNRQSNGRSLLKISQRMTVYQSGQWQTARGSVFAAAEWISNQTNFAGTRVCDELKTKRQTTWMIRGARFNDGSERVCIGGKLFVGISPINQPKN